MVRTNGSVVRDLAKGAAAGLAATWVMDRVTTAILERQSDATRGREERARDGRTAYARAAEKIAGRVGIEASEEQIEKAGQLMHWWLGAEAGMAFARARRRFDSAGRLKGLGFGTVFWLGMDEIANPLLGFTKGPRAFPWQTHARGLAGHLAFGLTAYLALELLDRFA